MPPANSEKHLDARIGFERSEGSLPSSEPPLQLGHVGLTVSRRLVSAEGRRRIVDFFTTCFGFEERPEHGRDGELLVMALGRVDRFIILFGDDSPITVGNWHHDHCAFVCSSIEEFHARAGRARAYAAEDPTCRFDDYEVEEVAAGPWACRVHKVYMQPAGLPLAFELQYWEHAPGIDDPENT